MKHTDVKLALMLLGFQEVSEVPAAATNTWCIRKDQISIYYDGSLSAPYFYENKQDSRENWWYAGSEILRIMSEGNCRESG